MNTQKKYSEKKRKQKKIILIISFSLTIGFAIIIFARLYQNYTTNQNIYNQFRTEYPLTKYYTEPYQMNIPIKKTNNLDLSYRKPITTKLLQIQKTNKSIKIIYPTYNYNTDMSQQETLVKLIYLDQRLRQKNIIIDPATINQSNTDHDTLLANTTDNQQLIISYGKQPNIIITNEKKINQKALIDSIPITTKSNEKD